MDRTHLYRDGMGPFIIIRSWREFVTHAIHSRKQFCKGFVFLCTDTK